jgi:aldehyde dehydrogenase (NAD+)
MLVGPAVSKVVYEPLGVICVMGSWNFPLYTTLSPFIYVIASGNTAVLKPSELAPHTFLALRNLLRSYLDSSCYICIEGKIEVAKALPTKKFDGICFTGSSEKGKLVAAAAAQNLIPCILELGGKSPSVVDADADLELAAKKIAFGRFVNAG